MEVIMKEFYSYPCAEHLKCPVYCESISKGETFTEVCENHCACCPDCKVLDISYEQMERGAEK